MEELKIEMQEMTKEVKMEIVKLTELASPTVANMLNVSDETGFYIMRLLDHLPEIEKYHKSLSILKSS